jgi:hypothetical protein
VAKLTAPTAGAAPIVIVPPQPVSVVKTYVDSGDYGTYTVTNLIPWELTSVAQTSNAVSVFEGMPIQLQSVASSVAPLSYQWRHAGLPISGETSDSIVLPLAGGNVGGNYSVVVSSTNGTIESVPTTWSGGWEGPGVGN